MRIDKRRTPRSRIDGKDVLRLQLTAPGFDTSVLSAFRPRLIAGAAASLLFDTWLTWCRDRQLGKAGGRQRTDATHLLAAVRTLNRSEVVGDTVRHALNRLAVVAPAWLRAISPAEWKDRYARRAEDNRLPTTSAAHAALALAIGHEGWRLLATIDQADPPPYLREVPTVAILRAGLDAQLLVGRHPALLARGEQHPPGSAVHQLPRGFRSPRRPASTPPNG